MLSLRFAVFFFLLVFSCPVFAAQGEMHGISMHGQPKYEAGFDHFDYANPHAPQGGTLHLGAIGTYDSLNPFIVRGTVPTPPAFSLFSTGPVFEPLMARSWDEPFSLYGLIAKSIEVPEDRSFISFTLRPEAHWQDGKPITADDVLFSFRTLRDQGRPNHRTYYKRVARAEKLGPMKVRFDFKKNPDGTIDREMPLIMGLMPVLPQHDWIGRDFDKTTLRPLLGSGPYKITNVDQGRSVTLEKDKNYWAKNLAAQKGFYNFDKIIIDFYRDDNIALQAFKAGQYDLRRESDPRKWATSYILADDKVKDLKLESFPHGRPEKITGFVFNTRRSLFKDKALRHALSLAFDFDWMNKALFHGLYKRARSFFPNAALAMQTPLPEGEEKTALEKYKDILPPEIFLKDPRLPEGNSRRESLLAAADILEAAGYVVKDGLLMTPEGKAVSFEIMLATPTDEKIALEWARNLKRLGVRAHVRTVDSAQYQARLTSFDYDVTIASWYNSLSPGNEQTYFWSCKAAAQNGTRNYPGVCDRAVDALARDIPAARTREELVGAVRALDRVLVSGAYLVPFYYLGTDQIAYWQNKISHPETVPVYGPILETWWAKKK